MASTFNLPVLASKCTIVGENRMLHLAFQTFPFWSDFGDLGWGRDMWFPMHSFAFKFVAGIKAFRNF